MPPAAVVIEVRAARVGRAPSSSAAAYLPPGKRGPDRPQPPRRDAPSPGPGDPLPLPFVLPLESRAEEPALPRHPLPPPVLPAQERRGLGGERPVAAVRRAGPPVHRRDVVVAVQVADRHEGPVEGGRVGAQEGRVLEVPEGRLHLRRGRRRLRPVPRPPRACEGARRDGPRAVVRRGPAYEGGRLVRAGRLERTGGNPPPVRGVGRLGVAQERIPAELSVLLARPRPEALARERAVRPDAAEVHAVARVRARLTTRLAPRRRCTLMVVTAGRGAGGGGVR
mmetsp:Transcript_21503/g.49307  ORF Transcript_21503/g.49307 Transcript_21503/m.49307 type:complete len:281 (+) Transcript_21503:1664-2506(+)